MVIFTSGFSSGKIMVKKQGGYANEEEINCSVVGSNYGCATC